MAKITPIQVGITNGEDAADRINEAIKTVEVDGTTVTGDGINTPLSAVGAQSIPLSWLKVASVLNTDPLAGNIGFNNIDLSLVTEIYISDTSHQPMDVSKMLADSEGSGILIQQKNDDSKFIIFIVGTVTDETGYSKFEITEYDSGAIFDDDAELITTYTAAVSTGGGHTIQDKNDINFTQQPVLKYTGKVIDGTGKTTIVPRFDEGEDVDTTGLQNADIPAYNSTTEKWEPNGSALNINILPSSEVVNANGLINTELEHGYSFFKIIAKNSSGAAVTVSIGSVASGTDIVNAGVAAASSDTSFTIAKDFFSIDNDTPLYVTSTDITGVITLYFTPITIQ